MMKKLLLSAALATAALASTAWATVACAARCTASAKPPEQSVSAGTPATATLPAFFICRYPPQAYDGERA